MLDSQDEVGTVSAGCGSAGSAGSAGSELPVPPVPAELARATPGERRSCGTARPALDFHPTTPDNQRSNNR